MTLKIHNIEKDRAKLTTHPDFNNRDNLRINKAYLASKLSHLEKVRATLQRDTLKAKLAHYREKPGGIWSKLGKE